jgi:alpha,alpha-trehalase
MMRSSTRVFRTISRTLVAFGVTTACHTSQSSVPTATPTATVNGTHLYDPARELGALFHDIQLARIFPDSKTLVDARPRVAPAELSARYERVRHDATFSLRAFVDSNFDAPDVAGGSVRSDTTQTMDEHIRSLWPLLTRAADPIDPRSSLIPLPGAYVVPGGRFREVYYWDSYRMGAPTS